MCGWPAFPNKTLAVRPSHVARLLLFSLLHPFFAVGHVRLHLHLHTRAPRPRVRALLAMGTAARRAARHRIQWWCRTFYTGGTTINMHEASYDWGYSDWDAHWNTAQPGNWVIIGSASYHDNGYEDRRFTFRFGRAYNMYLTSCSWTSWLNSYGACRAAPRRAVHACTATPWVP